MLVQVVSGLSKGLYFWILLGTVPLSLVKLLGVNTIDVSSCDVRHRHHFRLLPKGMDTSWGSFSRGLIVLRIPVFPCFLRHLCVRKRVYGFRSGLVVVFRHT